MQVRPASCPSRTYSKEQTQGYTPSLECQWWRCIQGLAVHDTPFPYFHPERPNTLTLAVQEVVVGKSYMEEGLFAKQHKLTNQEPIP